MKQALQKQEGAFRTKCNHNREGCKEYTSVKKRQTSNHLKKAAQSKDTRIVHQGKIEKEETQIEELQEDLEMVEATMCRRFSGVCVILQAGNCEPGRAIPHVVLYGEES